MNLTLPYDLRLAAPDLVAVLLLLACWFGIGWIIECPPAGKPSVSVLMKRFRREWMTHFITRQPRIFDSNILTTLREGTSFFASACMIATGGLLALIGNVDRLRGLAEGIELVHDAGALMQAKLMMTMFFVVNAFLKFVWAHRLFGYCAVMMAAVPNEPEDPLSLPRAMQAAELNITAARSFNAGLRSVYFALGSLGWLAGPWVLMGATAVVLFVSWRREFASTSRQVILGNLLPSEPPSRIVSPETGPRRQG